MSKVEEQLKGFADRYGIQIIYAFGRRADVAKKWKGLLKIMTS